mmetsp:Transcript_21810/g.24676  ORF Transcript_21810/g.24676 Transcript_21810/m.24676 type:complete len:101 (-) Transcript_21810:427-729(-)
MKSTGLEGSEFFELADQFIFGLFVSSHLKNYSDLNSKDNALLRYLIVIPRRPILDIGNSLKFTETEQGCQRVKKNKKRRDNNLLSFEREESARGENSPIP